MINLTLYKQGIKESIKPLLILAAVLTMYITIIISLYDPAVMGALDEFQKVMPQVMEMVGMSGESTNLIGFMINYLYGFILLLFPMLFSILTANRLIAKQVDDGSITYLLASPVSRVKIALTQIKVLITGVLLIIIYITAIEIIAAQVYFVNSLNIKKLLTINLGLLGLQVFISSICFLASAIFNESKYSIAFGAGIPLLSFVIQMMANMRGAAENFKYATFFTLFSPENILKGINETYISIAILFIGALVLFTISITIFRKKDLPI